MPQRVIQLILSLCCSLLLLGSAAGQSRQAEPEAGAVDLAELARTIVGEARSDIERSRRIIDWLNTEFEWTYTDYKNRTVQEIIAQRGGNCAEQVRVARALMSETGIQTRRMAEVNIQPRSEQRQQNAEAVIEKWGLKGSVFGLRHNDHRWIEVYDRQSRSWVPADPSLGLLGLKDWLSARVGFDSRPTHHILPSRDMLVPIAIFAMDDRESTILEDRSSYYLVDQFNQLYHGDLQNRQAWKEWTRLIAEIVPHVKATFLREENLHEQNAAIERLAQVYEKLKAEETTR